MAALLEKRQARVQLNETRSKLKIHESRSAHFQSEITRLQKELEHLNADNRKQEKSHEQILTETRGGMQAQMLRRTVLGLAFGLIGGGFLMGTYMGNQGELKTLRATMELNVRAQVAESKLALMESENMNLHKQLKQIQTSYMEMREMQAVTMTKLNILLTQMLDKKTRKLGALDMEALRASLQMNEERLVSDPSEIFPMAVAVV